MAPLQIFVDPIFALAGRMRSAFPPLLAVFSMVGLLAQLLLGGCATAPAIDPATGGSAPSGVAALGASPSTSLRVSRVPSAQAAARITQPVARGLSRRLLSKNPEYAPVLVAMSAGIDELFIGQREITPKSIADWTGALAKSHELDADDRKEIAFYIMDAYELYRLYVPTGVILSTDPDVQLVLRSFRDGIDQGLQFHAAFSD